MPWHFQKGRKGNWVPSALVQANSNQANLHLFLAVKLRRDGIVTALHTAWHHTTPPHTTALCKAAYLPVSVTVPTPPHHPKSQPDTV
mmetsp:Transcript_27409/g.44594  ORF Transcript_27409/g.44594 Transcript_27409/m.44594 type:complete len:87 (+) Transcript_27409:564-824(+)